MKRYTITAIAIIAGLALAGCQSGLSYKTEVRKITIKSEPSNAKVYQINPADSHEVFLGLTPVVEQPVNVIKSFSGDIDQQAFDYITSKVGMVEVRIEKPGYMPYTGNLPTDKKDTLSHRIELEQAK